MLTEYILYVPSKQQRCNAAKVFIKEPYIVFASHSIGKSKFTISKRVLPQLKIEKAILDQICGVCQMYSHCLESLTQIASDLIIGLGCSGTLVAKMWHFLRGVMGTNVDKVIHIMSSGEQHSVGCILALFCQIAQYLLA